MRRATNSGGGGACIERGGGRSGGGGGGLGVTVGGGRSRGGGGRGPTLTLHTLSPSFPMLEANVQQYNVLLVEQQRTEHDTPCRKTPHDDCCGYCERYCEGKITANRRSEIEDWRNKVNSKMDALTPKQKPHAKHADPRTIPKLKFLREPPLNGVPDRDPGFWRVKTPKDVVRYNKEGSHHYRAAAAAPPASQQPNWGAKRRVDTDVVAISANVADMAIQKGKVSPGRTPPSALKSRPGNALLTNGHSSTSALVQPTAAPRDKKGGGGGRDTSAADNGPPLFNVSVNGGGVTQDSASNDTHSSHHSYRSCSNELLNVITIDDAVRHHREKFLANKGWAPTHQGADPNRQSTVPSLPSAQGHVHPHPHSQPHPHTDTSGMGAWVAEQDSSRLQSDGTTPFPGGHGVPHFPTPTTTPVSRKLTAFSMATTNPDVPLDFTDSLTEPSQHQENIIKAIDNVVDTKEVLNNNARTGLFRHSKRYSDVLQNREESKRFQRLNRNLHRLIETEFIPNSRMATRLQHHPRIKSARERCHSEEMSQTNRLSLPSAVKFRPVPNHGHKHGSAKLYSHSNGTHFTTSSYNKSKENFLEILMDMEEDASKE